MTVSACWLLVLVVGCFPTTAFTLAFGSNTKKTNTVKVSVCQNKDCCQRFRLQSANLVQTLQHLVNDKIQIEATGCQSKCNVGPNLSINEKTFEGIRDAQEAAALLEMQVEDFVISPTLLAAVTVMEKAHGAASPELKEKNLNSVITVLEASPDTDHSAANGHAHAMRARVRLDTCQFEKAMEDAKRATELLPFHPTAWRTLVDAQEACGDLAGAMDALTSWLKSDPSFATKINKEKARLAAMATRKS